MASINVDEIEVVQGEEGYLSSPSRVSTDPSLDLDNSGNGGGGGAGGYEVSVTSSYDVDSELDCRGSSDVDGTVSGSGPAGTSARGVLIIRRDRAGGSGGANCEGREGSETQSEPRCIARVSEAISRLGFRGVGAAY
ncbi:unnamed protein product [Linum trigynum]|uniref:Uncharacterized protein n=1 Tax=Linum trigynum TaxID=586398 RepID=A0AAV2D7Q3_9ROSI